jgi:hypothetical protein
MADVEPVEPGAIVRRAAPSVVPSPGWPVRPVRRRTTVAAAMRALTTEPLLPASALAVAAWAAARVAARAAGRGRATRGPVGADAVGRVLGPGVPDAMVEVSWTHVEVHWRS